MVNICINQCTELIQKEHRESIILSLPVWVNNCSIEIDLLHAFWIRSGRYWIRLFSFHFGFPQTQRKVFEHVELECPLKTSGISVALGFSFCISDWVQLHIKFLLLLFESKKEQHYQFVSVSLTENCYFPPSSYRDHRLYSI